MGSSTVRFICSACLILTIACLTFFANSTHAETPTFVIYAESWAPYNYLFEEEVIGISTDIVREMFTLAELNHEIVLVPWARGYQLAKTQENAFIFMTKRTLERESQFQWIGPLQEINLSLYRLSSRDDLQISRLGQLNQYVVGVERGGSSHLKLIKLGLEDQNQIYPVNKFSQLLGMLFKQRIDFVISSDTSLQFQMNMTGYRKQEVSYALDFSSAGTFYLAANNSVDIEVVEALQFWLDSLKQQGKLIDIQQRYLAH